MIEVVTEAVAVAHDRTVLLRADEVWITFAAPWWALHRWLWWALTPGTKARLRLRLRSGELARIRAVRIARRFVRMGEARP